jgi:hypothetical protein
VNAAAQNGTELHEITKKSGLSQDLMNSAAPGPERGIKHALRISGKSSSRRLSVLAVRSQESADWRVEGSRSCAISGGYFEDSAG